MTYELHVLRKEDELTADQLKAALSELVDRFLQKMMPPENQIAIAAEKEKIVEKLFISITSKGNDTPISINQFENNPNFLNKLIIHAIAIAMTDKFLNTKALEDVFEKLKKLAHEKGIDFDPTKINKPDDLKNIFTPDELKNILTPAVTNKLNEFYNELQKTLTPLSMEPKLVGSKINELSNVKDPYIYLFGLTNSHTTGSYPVVILSNKGNINSIVDWNPYHGLAPIDEVNRYDTSLSGDPLGLDEAKLDHFLGISGNTFAKLVDGMHNHARLQAPKPAPR